MNLADATVVVRPRTQVEVIDLGFAFVFGVAPRLFSWLGAVVLLPCWALCVAARYWAGFGWVLVWTLAIGLGVVVQGVFTVAAGRVLFARAVRVLDVLGAYSRRLPSYFAVLLLSRVVIAVAMLVVVFVPAAWIRGAFVHEACLLEEASPREAWKRSARFASNLPSGMVLFAGLFGLTGMCVISAEALGLGILEFAFMLGEPEDTLFGQGGSVFAIAGYFLSVPLCACARFLTYIDGRTRQDAWDVQVRFMSIQTEDAERRA